MAFFDHPEVAIAAEGLLLEVMGLAVEEFRPTSVAIPEALILIEIRVLEVRVDLVIVQVINDPIDDLPLGKAIHGRVDVVLPREPNRGFGEEIVRGRF